MRALLFSMFVVLALIFGFVAQPEAIGSRVSDPLDPVRWSMPRAPVTEADYTAIQATVVNVIQHQFPHAQVTVRVTSSTNTRILDVSREQRTLTARNFFWQTAGRINLHDPRNIRATAAYYLLPGDEIHAKLFPGPRRVGSEPTWYVYGISRGLGAPPSQRTAREIRMIDGLELSIEIERQSFQAGEPVRMTLGVTNTTDAPRTLEFSSGQHYDFIVRRAGAEIWRWSADKAFIQALTQITLAPGETRKFAETWQQVDNRGRQVAAGEYHVIGMVTTMGRPQPIVGPAVITITSEDREST